MNDAIAFSRFGVGGAATFVRVEGLPDSIRLAHRDSRSLIGDGLGGLCQMLETVTIPALPQEKRYRLNIRDPPTRWSTDQGNSSAIVAIGRKSRSAVFGSAMKP